MKRVGEPKFASELVARVRAGSPEGFDFVLQPDDLRRMQGPQAMELVAREKWALHVIKVYRRRVLLRTVLLGLLCVPFIALLTAAAIAGRLSVLPLSISVILAAVGCWGAVERGAPALGWLAGLKTLARRETDERLLETTRQAKTAGWTEPFAAYVAWRDTLGNRRVDTSHS